MLKRNFTRLFNIFTIISCIMHIMFIFYTNSNPAIPEIILHNKNIMDVNMPLSFIFCLKNTNTELQKKTGTKKTYKNNLRMNQYDVHRGGYSLFFIIGSVVIRCI